MLWPVWVLIVMVSPSFFAHAKGLSATHSFNMSNSKKISVHELVDEVAGKLNEHAYKLRRFETANLDNTNLHKTGHNPNRLIIEIL